MNDERGLAPHPSTPSPHSTTPARGRSRGPWRWLVALAATAAFVVSGSGLVAFAQNGAGATQGPIFLPATTPVYIEARLDMPAGQADALANFLSAFPGFGDAAGFEQRLDTMVDGFLAEQTGGELTYTEDIEPWITGEVGLGIVDLVDAMAQDREPEQFLAAVGVRDRAAAEAFVADLIERGGVTLQEEPYGGTTILSDEDAAVAVTDEFVLLAPTPELVRSAVDAIAGEVPRLADRPSFADAFARVPAGHLAAAYMDFAAFAPLIEAAIASGAGGMGSAAMTEGMLAQLPVDMTAYLMAGPNNLTLEAFVTPSEGAPAPIVGESELALRFPAGTQLLIESRQLGENIETSLTQMFSMMGDEESQQLQQFEQMLGTPLPTFFDFLGDTAIGGALTEGQLWLGLVAEVTDEATATERIDDLLGFARLAAGGSDGEVSIVESQIGDATVTTITLPTEAAGAPVDFGGSLSVTVTDGMLYLGTGEFVTGAVDQDAATSLGAAPAYLEALGENATNSGLMFVDIGALLTSIDPLLSMMSPEWSEVRPWIGGLDRFVAVGGVADDLLVARMSLYVD